MGDSEVPADNPFKPKAAVAPPTDIQESKANAAVEIHDVDIESAALPPRHDSQRHLAAASDSPTPPGEPEEWTRRKPVHEVKGKCYGCRKCMAGCHTIITGSPTCSTVVVSIIAVLNICQFILSCVLLSSQATAGTCPSPCSSFRDTATCVAYGYAGGQSCEDVCSSSSVAPFRFTSAQNAALGAVYCAFPKMNTNWRIPLSFFTSLLLIIGAVAICMQWRGFLVWNSLLTFIAGGIYFFVMIIDSAAVDKGQRACSAKFNTSKDINCDLRVYSAVCILDAVLFFLCFYVGAVLFGNYRRLRAAVKSQMEQKAKEPPKKEKSEMFNTGTGDYEEKPNFA